MTATLTKPTEFPQFKKAGAGLWHPIPFTDDLSDKVRRGLKHVTRRPLREKIPARFQEPQTDIAPIGNGGRWTLIRADDRSREYFPEHPQPGFQCPYGVKGDSLWVREAAKLRGLSGDRRGGRFTEFDLAYRADGQVRDFKFADIEGPGLKMPYSRPDKHQPPMFMPKWASRTALLVEEIRIERLQDITEEEAIAEGMTFDGVYWRGAPHAIKETPRCLETAREAFVDIWASIYGPHSWHVNPWVWRVGFKLLEAL